MRCDVQTCVDYFSIVETTLLSDGSNIYKLRELLLKDPTELLNDQLSTCSSLMRNHLHLDEEWHQHFNINPVCSCSCRCITYSYCNCSPAMTTGTVALTLCAGPLCGVYSYIHPALLNQLQIQLLILSVWLRTFVN